MADEKLTDWVDKAMKNHKPIESVKKEFPASKTINLKSAKTKNPNIVMIQVPAIFCEKNPNGGLIFFNVPEKSFFTSMPVNTEALPCP